MDTMWSLSTLPLLSAFISKVRYSLLHSTVKYTPFPLHISQIMVFILAKLQINERKIITSAATAMSQHAFWQQPAIRPQLAQFVAVIETREFSSLQVAPHRKQKSNFKTDANSNRLWAKPWPEPPLSSPNNSLECRRHVHHHFLKIGAQVSIPYSNELWTYLLLTMCHSNIRTLRKIIVVPQVLIAKCNKLTR